MEAMTAHMGGYCISTIKNVPGCRQWKDHRV